MNYEPNLRTTKKKRLKLTSNMPNTKNFANLYLVFCNTYCNNKLCLKISTQKLNSKMNTRLSLPY